MPMYVAEAADVHENVKAEGLAGGEFPEQLVVTAAMPHAQVDDLGAVRFIQCGNTAADLPVGIVALAVEQCGGQICLERIRVVDQGDKGRGRDGLALTE